MPGHRWAECGGSADEFVARGLWGTLGHTLFDTGGPCDLTSLSIEQNALCSGTVRAALASYRHSRELGLTGEYPGRLLAFVRLRLGLEESNELLQSQEEGWGRPAGRIEL